MSVCLQAIKYGVVSTSTLLRDLWKWDSFYVAGRLHKPVLFLTRDADIDRAAAANIAAALAAALLLLPARFTAKVLQILTPNERTNQQGGLNTSLGHIASRCRCWHGAAIPTGAFMWDC